MFGWLRTRCPLEPTAREWLDARWRWLTDEFGSDLMIETPSVLPTDEFFPDPYDGFDDDSVRALVDRVCDYMHVSHHLVDLSFYSDAHQPEFVNEEGHAIGGIAGQYEEGATTVIHLARSQLSEPMVLVGTIAHELAHARLLGENRISVDAFDNELATDLTVVFHGLGIFLANAPRHWESDATVWPGTSIYKPEYMTVPMFGYALALRASLREEPPLPEWVSHLERGVRAEYKANRRFLDRSQ